MEQDLNEKNILSNEDNFENYFELEHKNQDVTKLPQFKRWYEKAYQNAKNKTLKDEHHIFTITFCNKCCSYTICSTRGGFCHVQCTECNSFFCIGCSRQIENFNFYNNDETICLKGFFKLFYLRIKYRRSEIIGISTLFIILHIFFCLLFTPLYIGLIFNFFGFMVHPKYGNKKEISPKKSTFFLYILFLKVF